MIGKLRVVLAIFLSAFCGFSALMATASGIIAILAILRHGPRRELWLASTVFFAVAGIGGWWIANRLWPDRRFPG